LGLIVLSAKVFERKIYLHTVNPPAKSNGLRDRLTAENFHFFAFLSYGDFSLQKKIPSSKYNLDVQTKRRDQKSYASQY